MYTPNDDTQNYPFVDYTQLNEPTNQNTIKAPKMLRQRLRKRYYETLGTIVINSPMSTPPLYNRHKCIDTLFRKSQLKII